MLHIGITGQSGFLGTHLYNHLGLQPGAALVPFERRAFEPYASDPGADPKAFDTGTSADGNTLCDWVRQCDVIIHLAALNRHPEPETLYETNVALVDRLIHAMEATGARPHVLFSSSTQEEKDNPYGRSKAEGRKRLSAWAQRNGATFTGLVIPNVFGPFGLPFYNSVVATFCHQLTHGETPRIEVDGVLKLIYVDNLVKAIWRLIQEPAWAQATGGHGHTAPTGHAGADAAPGSLAHVIPDGDAAPDGHTDAIPDGDHHAYTVPADAEITVSALLRLLEGFRADYFDKGVIPALAGPFELNLFNTFRSFIDQRSFFPKTLTRHADDRGAFVEIARTHPGGQVSFSTTLPGITRGEHFHTRKIERFAVLRGQARIALRRIGTDEVLAFDLDGDKPSFVDMPVWYTHNITNTGNGELLTLFWINEFFDPTDPDTYFVKVNPPL